MALASLADLSDIEDRLGRDLDADESRRADVLLRDASAMVRAYCRRDFTESRDVVRLRPRGWKLILPQRPVTAVHELAAVQSFGTTILRTPLTLWSWVAGAEVYLGDTTLVINGPELDYDQDKIYVEVDYSYGYAEVPDDVRAVVANVAVKALIMPSGGLVDMETIGPMTVRYAGVNNGPLALTEPDRAILNRYRSHAARTMELR